jgi:hypothetical protein
MGDVQSLVSRQVPPDPTKTAATNEHRSERSEQLDSARARARDASLRERRRAPLRSEER